MKCILGDEKCVCSEAVVQRCSVKEIFIEISQIHRKTPVPESLFIKVTGLFSLGTLSNIITANKIPDALSLMCSKYNTKCSRSEMLHKNSP